MIYGSVCSGIEAASVAWEPLGWRPAFFSEIEKFPRAVLSHHYPDVPLHGDFTTIEENSYEPIDLLVGGTPCQSFSVAGKRLGLDDPRGNLSIEYLRLARRLRPEWLVWENVPGVLSSGSGRDFGAFLGLLGQIGYGWAYRVLDAQYFGVPQRRRRVFLVGHSSGYFRRAAAVLFERESLRGDSAPSRETGERIAPTISARPSGGGGLGTDFDLDGGLRAVTHASRGEGFDASEGGTGSGTPLVPTVSPAIKARDYKGPSSDATGDGQPLVPVAFSSKDCAQDAGSVSPPLRAMGSTDGRPNGGGQVAVAFDMRGREGGAMPEGPHDTANIRAADGGSRRSYVAYRTTGNDGVYETGDRTGALNTATDPNQNILQSSMAVRRLTPIECERLQGFPDNYTQIPYRNKPADRCPDGPRYKALGNSMAVPCMRWIGERIQAASDAWK